MDEPKSRTTSITVAVIGFAGIVLAALIGAFSQLAAVDRPIRATQTAEARGAATLTPADARDPVTATGPESDGVPRSVTAVSSTPPSDDIPTHQAPGIPPWELFAEPPVARNNVGGEHTVYVTLRDLNGFVVTGAAVYLVIEEGPHAGLQLTRSSDADGHVVFNYSGDAAGTDVIHVWAGTDTYDAAPPGMRAEVTCQWL
jgi:hypothetical protein